MRDYAKDLAQLAAKHAEAVTALETESAIAAELGRLGIPEPSSIYVTDKPLYGLARVTLSYGDSHCFYIAKRKTWQDVADLAKAFPPKHTKLRCIKSGWTSVMAGDWCDRQPETEKEKWTSERDIAPFTVEIDANSYTNNVCVTWYVTISGMACKVSVFLPHRYGAAAESFWVSAWRDHKAGYRYKAATCHVPDRAATLHGDDGDALAEVETHMQGRGDASTIHRYRLIWVPYRGDAGATGATVADLARAMIGTNQ